MDGFTDIRTGGWVARLPAWLVPYVLLGRFDRPIGAWLLYLPGLWAICLGARGVGQGVRLALLFLVGAGAMRAAGCVVNDLWDRKMDAKVVRTARRPLASGAIKPLSALIFMFLLCGVGLAVLLQLNVAARWLGVASLGLVVLYPLAKRVTWWPQIVLGFTFGWGAPMGYAATQSGLGWPGMALYGAAILWTLGYDTIYAHQDREDDALIGVKSTARLWGRNTPVLLSGAYGGAVLLLGLAMALTGLRAAGLVALLLPAGLLAWQIVRLDIDDPQRCLRLFKLNREVGFAVAFAVLVGRFAG